MHGLLLVIGEEKKLEVIVLTNLGWFNACISANVELLFDIFLSFPSLENVRSLYGAISISILFALCIFLFCVIYMYSFTMMSLSWTLIISWWFYWLENSTGLRFSKTLPVNICIYILGNWFSWWSRFLFNYRCLIVVYLNSQLKFSVCLKF